VDGQIHVRPVVVAREQGLPLQAVYPPGEPADRARDVRLEILLLLLDSEVVELQELVDSSLRLEPGVGDGLEPAQLPGDPVRSLTVVPDVRIAQLEL
jgi:hypothetical protein